MKDARSDNKMTHEARIEAALRRADFQNVIFGSEPRRAALMRAAIAMQTDSAPVRLRVHRNHPFEFVASLLPAFSAFNERNIDVAISDYDDSLSLAVTSEAEIELIWLDYDRYKLAPEELVNWLKSRIAALRAKSQAPILVAAWPGQTEIATAFNENLRTWQKHAPGVHILPMDEVAAALGDNYIDQRMSGVGATRLSERANVTIARLLGLCWLPSVLEPRLKAVVFDLDNTLWGGVLGEDGQDGVNIGGGYQALQKHALALGESGLFLGILSRNEDADVETMLSSGRMHLTMEALSAKSVSWGRKADGMAAIAKTLRIGFDAILFVDDNPGELAAVASACPGIKLLHASVDPQETNRALEFYPGLFTWGANDADGLRSADLAKNDARQTLRSQSGDDADYLASLKLELCVAVDPVAHRERLHGLSQKTNQFNTTLRRFSATDVADYLEDPKKHIVALWLTDRFSNSGLIGAMFVSASGFDELSVDEICISCRALGRGVEDAMMVAAIDAACAAHLDGTNQPITSVKFAVKTGPRNAPAHDWLAQFSGQKVIDRTEITISWTDPSHLSAVRSLPIRIQEGEPDANQRD